MWKTLDASQFEKQAYRFESHTFRSKKFKSFSILFCQGCGLVTGNNSLTRWAIKKGCNWTYHSEYRIVRRALMGA